MVMRWNMLLNGTNKPGKQVSKVVFLYFADISYKMKSLLRHLWTAGCRLQRLVGMHCKTSTCKELKQKIFIREAFKIKKIYKKSGFI